VISGPRYRHVTSMYSRGGCAVATVTTEWIVWGMACEDLDVRRTTD